MKLRLNLYEAVMNLRLNRDSPKKSPTFGDFFLAGDMVFIPNF
jgi:hypothetical protein